MIIRSQQPTNSVILLAGGTRFFLCQWFLDISEDLAETGALGGDRGGEGCLEGEITVWAIKCWWFTACWVTWVQQFFYLEVTVQQQCAVVLFPLPWGFCCLLIAFV